MRGVRVFITVLLVSLLGAGCTSSGGSTTIGGHTFNNVDCGLLGAAFGATIGGAASGGSGAGLGALGGLVLSHLFCGEEEIMEDSDGDGVADGSDECPNTPAETDNGCPADADGDGVPDFLDECPNTPAETDNGCPADADGDGVPDFLDECPDVAGDADTGCPAPVEEEEVLFIESIHFDFDSAAIKPISKAVLDARAVPIMRDNSGIKVRIEGHTDSVGADRYNQLLSLRRAEAVRDYLISQGIADTNLSIAGYGESNPIDSNDTKAGRANNRRVEFVIR